MADVHHTQVIGDSLRLRQILNNLISNAIKFTDEGHILIKASTALSEDNDHVILEVEIIDTGIGIEKDKLQKLFKAFSQEDVSTTRRYGGTGLGLSIVANLCSLMGGACHVDSEKGQGSTFRFSLKFQREKDVEHGLSEMIDLSGLSVQVQQQSNEVKNSLIKLLNQWHATVIEVEQDHNVDIVISDYDEKSSNERNSLPNGHENYVLTLSLKQRHQDIVFTEQEHRVIIYRPIQPLQLATALSSLCGRALKTPHKHNVSNSSEDTKAQLLRSLNQHTLLIVDDNEINQVVASGILEHYGFPIKTASNGREALRLMSESNDISLVLMDCQMPIMDGFTTTQKLRQGEAGEKMRKTPVIAMTASAMTGDREDCLNAGMNDYLTKPISPQDLEDKVSYWLMTLHSVLTPTNSPSDSVKDATIPIGTHTAILNTEATLKRLLDDEELLNQMLDMFVEGAPSQIKQIQTAIESQDYETVRQLAHRMRGGAAAIGAESLSMIAAELETAALNQQPELLTRLYQEIEHAWRRLGDEIELARGQYKINEN